MMKKMGGGGLMSTTNLLWWRGGCDGYAIEIVILESSKRNSKIEFSKII